MTSSKAASFLRDLAKEIEEGGKAGASWKMGYLC
jgi:hypothetical protein